MNVRSLPLEPRVLVLAHLVERLAEVAQDVELVEQDGRLRGVLGGRVAERLPHVHHRQANAFGPWLFPQKAIKLVHARLAAIRPAEPDRPVLLQVADHDAIVVALAHRDLVDADAPCGRGLPGASSCSRMYCFSRRLTVCQSRFSSSAMSLIVPLRQRLPDVAGKALGMQRVLQQKLQPLALHAAAPAAVDAPHLQIEVNAILAHRADPAPVVAGGRTSPNALSHTFRRPFFSPPYQTDKPRVRITKDPVDGMRGRKPGNRYASATRRGLRALGIRPSCQNFLPRRYASNAYEIGTSALQ